MNAAKLRALPFVALLLPLDFIVAVVILAADLASLPWRFGRRWKDPGPVLDVTSVTIQILNWDGKHLLEECLPSVMEAVRYHSARSGRQPEVLVVDNGSSDGSIEFLRTRFPEVRLLELGRNYGFSDGNNRGFPHVQTDIVVLLNNDMLVAPDFLQPLLKPFGEREVFAVTSQITFADPDRRREETGKTRARFEGGFFRLWHAEISVEDEVRDSLPVFWVGGGSCAVDMRKLRSLGGFDSLYRPFYVEDADISWQAWKRGWQCLLAPASRVVHKHRGTTRPKYGDDFVENTIRRNQYLFIWKNVTSPGMILGHLVQLPRIHGSAIMQKGARFELRAYIRALWRLPFAVLRRVSGIPEYWLCDSHVMRLTQ